MSDLGGAQPGTVPRGKRHPITTRVPEDQYSKYKAAADELGIPVGSYVAMVIADAHNLPRPEYIIKEIERAQEKRRAESNRAHQRRFELEVPMARTG